jgi:glycerol-3-phosphate O-acyltransferase
MKPYRFDLMQGWFSKKLFSFLFSNTHITPKHLKKWRGIVSKGMVIPVLDNSSQLDFLALYYGYQNAGGNFPRFPLGISMIPWISIRGWFSILRALILWIFKKVCFFDPFTGTNGEKISKIGRVPFVLFVKPESARVQKCLYSSSNPLSELIHLQQKVPSRIFLVPHIVVYDVIPRTEKKSLYGAFWGRMAAPKWTMRFKRLITRKEVQVRIGNPIDIQAVITHFQGASDEEIEGKIRQVLAEGFDRKLRGISGPSIPSRERMIEKILSNPTLRDYLYNEAIKQNKSFEDITEKARRYTREIASDLKISYVKNWERALKWVWQNLYDGVDINEEAEERIRKIAQHYPVVYIPSHKSHVDYFLLSYILYKMNLPMPFIAAGTNLSFWPMGPIFRRSGAFFIRRTFRNNPLYGEVFYHYVRALIAEGIPMEFFIEGGRSRTGKLILPKKGLLAMVLRAFNEKAAKDIYLVPTAISYERVVEEASYIRELRGEEKKKEKMRDLFRVRKIFGKRYGTVYLRFGKPLSLKNYLKRKDESKEPRTKEERQHLYQKTADMVIQEIQRAMAVTPSALVAAAILSEVDKSLRLSQIMKTAEFYRRLLEKTGAEFPNTQEDTEGVFRRVITLFTQDGVIKTAPGIDEEDPMFYAPSEKRISLEFSKNMMISHLAPLSIYCWALKTENTETVFTPYALFSFLVSLFKIEFLLNPEHTMKLYRTGRLFSENFSAFEMRKTRNLILSTLEGYLVAASFLAKGKEKLFPIDEKKLIQEMMKWGNQMLASSQIRCAESVTSAILKGGIRVFQSDGILAQTAVEKTPKGKGIEEGINFNAIHQIVTVLTNLLIK